MGGYESEERFAESASVRPFSVAESWASGDRRRDDRRSGVALTASFDVSRDVRSGNAYNLFPKSIGELVKEIGVREFRVTLTKGRWEYEWGSQGHGNAPGGAFTAAWLDDPSKWSTLNRALSGILCASLGQLKETTALRPRETFRQIDGAQQPMIGFLPRETVCTENLTPWLKLLPCRSQSGLAAAFFSPPKVFSSQYHSLSVHYRQREKENVQELRLEATMVFTGENVKFVGDLMAESAPAVCPLASASLVRIGERSRHDMLKEEWSQLADISLTDEDYPGPPAIRIERAATGTGQRHGGTVATLYAHASPSCKHPVKVHYLEVFPAFVRVYASSVRVNVNGERVNDLNLLQMLTYTPRGGEGGNNPAAAEITFDIPCGGNATISTQFENEFLHISSFPPDANRGLDIPPAMVAYAASVGSFSPTAFTFSDGLLIDTPLPDFSMPYNVVTLTCTVVAFFFGSLFNLLVRRRSKKPKAIAKTLMIPTSNEEEVKQNHSAATKLMRRLFFAKKKICKIT